MGLLELLMGKQAPAQPQWDAPAPAAPGQPLPTYDPAMAQGLAPFYKWFQDEPDVEGRAQILPLVDVKGGGIRLGNDGKVREYSVSVSEKTPLWLKPVSYTHLRAHET